MIDRKHNLPISKQADALKISRGSVYYRPRPVPKAELAIMHRLDRLHLEYPFAGSRMLRGLLAAEGCKIGRRHVRTLMRRMGIEALYRRPRTTTPEPGHKIYPYLLRGIEITRPNQVWAMDITYIPMARGFVYLAVVLDWFSRRVHRPCARAASGHAGAPPSAAMNSRRAIVRRHRHGPGGRRKRSARLMRPNAGVNEALNA
jgi:putative transposase